MKPRLKYADAFPTLDFEHMPMGAPLLLDGENVTFQGWHYGSIWLRIKRKTHFVKVGDPLIARLRTLDKST